MMTTLKRAVSAALALTNYGVLVADSSDGKPKYVDDNGNVYVLSSDGMRDRNLADNGGFDLAQRQTPGTLTTYSQTASRQYTADRWSITNENASVQYRRVDTAGTQQAGLQARYYGEYSKLTSTGKMVVSQPIEGFRCQHLRGRKVRFQVRLKASASKTVRLALLQLNSAGTLDSVPGISVSAPSGTFVSAFGANSTDPTFGTNLAKIAPDTADNATIATSGLSCSVTTAWQKFGGTFTMPTDYKNLVLVIFTDSQFAAGDLFGVSEVGLYDGTEVRDWSPIEYPLGLLVCQRTYCKTFGVDVAPVASAGANSGELRCASPVAASLAFSGWTYEYPAQMRNTNSVQTGFNPAAAGAQARNLSLSTDCTSTSLATTTDGKRLYITATTPASTVAGNIIGLHVTVDNEF